MAKIKTFRDLIVWQKSMRLVEEIYKVTNNFPSEEKFCLVQQLRKAAISIPSNIAEGYGRRATKDYKRFSQIAMGSIFEVLTQIEISKILGYLGDNTYSNAVESKVREIERMLSSLINKLN